MDYCRRTRLKGGLFRINGIKEKGCGNGEKYGNKGTRKMLLTFSIFILRWCINLENSSYWWQKLWRNLEMMVLIHKLYNSIGWATEWEIYGSAKTNQDSEILANQNWSHQLLSIFPTSTCTHGPSFCFILRDTWLSFKFSMLVFEINFKIPPPYALFSKAICLLSFLTFFSKKKKKDFKKSNFQIILTL